MEYTEEEKTFIKRNKEHLEKATDEIILQTLKKMLDDDVNATDVHWIEKRLRMILDEVFKDISFASKTVAMHRKNLFQRALAQAKKKAIVPIETDDEDEKIRNERCEAVCVQLAETIMEQDFLGSNEGWFNEVIRGDDELLAQNRLRDYVDAIFSGLLLSIDTSYTKAQKKLWGKEREDISMQDINDLIK